MIGGLILGAIVVVAILGTAWLGSKCDETKGKAGSSAGYP